MNLKIKVTESDLKLTQLHWEAHRLREHIGTFFKGLPLAIINSNNRDAANIGLSVGKFLGWSGGRIDDLAGRCSLPIKSTVNAENLGREIREACIDILENRKSRLASTAMESAFMSVDERLSRIENLLTGKGGGL